LLRGKGWKTWGDFLGTGSISKHERIFRPYKQARAYARSLNFQTLKDWQKFVKGEFPEKSKLPADIPSDPYGVYRNKGWTSWSDWLGKKEINSPSRRQFASANTARNLSIHL
jgi:hypothetical protein